MRVLHIGNELSWRGGENQIRLLVEGLKNLKASGREAVESFIAYPRESRGYERFHTLAETLGLPSRSAFDPRSIFQIVRFCRHHQIDLIDAHSSGGMSLALAAKIFLPKVKIVVHRRVDNAIKSQLFTRRKYMSPHVEKFICISRAIAKIVEDYGVDRQKISVVRSAVDDRPYARLDRVLARTRLEKLTHGSGKVLLGNASAFTDQKGYHTLIESLRFLHEKRLPFHAFLAGEGHLEPLLKQKVNQYGMQNSVTFLGHIQDVPEFLAGLDILAVPSNNEGLGTILLEGAFAGCALVSTRVGGIPEIIEHEKTGLLVNPRDAIGLAHELEKLILDAPKRQALAAAAQAHVRREFSLEAMVQGNLTIYKSLLK